MSIQKPTAAELQEWNRRLSDEGLSMGTGSRHLLYVDNTDIYQTTKTKTGSRGGRIRRYKLGERISHRLSCAQCSAPFTAKRRTALTCSNKCQVAYWRARKYVTDKSGRSEEGTK
jgi:hypothetical protein